MKNVNFEKLLLNSALLLMAVICFDHLLVMLSFITFSSVLFFAFPLSLAVSIALFFLLEKNTNRNEKVWTVFLSFMVICLSILVSAFYFDLSWDGQWYHQSAIYHLASDWNPFFEPIREFEKNNTSSILHFPKGSWYFAASIYRTFGNFESGKCLNFIVVFISLSVFYNALRQWGLSIVKSICISFLIILNPVIWSEITTFLVDGLVFLYLSLYIVTLFTWFRKHDVKYILIGGLAAINLINVKFTGLVFFCVLVLFSSIYILFRRREILAKFIGVHVLVIFLAILVFGFNPYVTNFIVRGHPLYPILGTEKYPSVFDRTGKDSNELYETPHNMRGKNVFVRMFYANFGKPDNAPYYKEKDANLAWPFTSKVTDWDAYHFHETRVSGFGPYFSGILILSFLLLLAILKTKKRIRMVLTFLLIALFCSLLFSKHLWWPRFGPQMWLLPIIPVCFSFVYPISKKYSLYTWIVTIILWINGSIVLLSHMSWETQSSIQLRKQLSELKKNNIPIEISYGYFIKSMDEKLTLWQIQYKTIPKKEMMRGGYKKLTSVVEGYPNMVLYREQNKNITALYPANKK